MEIAIWDYVCGVSDTLSAEYFSSLLGVATAETQSIKKDAGIEGDLEFGQKNISSLKRNLLNADEILRLPHNKLIVNIRGNKPLLLDKMIYTEHPLSPKLKDVSVSNYKPNWNDNKQVESKPKVIEQTKKEFIDNDEFEEITFDNFWRYDIIRKIVEVRYE